MLPECINSKYQPQLNLQWYNHHHQHYHLHYHQHHCMVASWIASDSSLVSYVLLSMHIIP